MRIDAVAASYNTNSKRNITPNFNGLIKCKSALPIIDRMPKEDILEFKQIEKRLSKTKFWDMKISSVGNLFDELKFHFINKRNQNAVITDGIYPYDRNGKTVRFYSIVYEPENTTFNSVETLNFKSEKRAKELFDKHEQYIQDLSNINYRQTPIDSLKIKEIELQMLEEGFQKVSRGKTKRTSAQTQTKPTIGNDLFK